MFSVSTGSVSGRECKIAQKDLHREDGKRDTEDPAAGNYQDRKDIFHESCGMFVFPEVSSLASYYSRCIIGCHWVQTIYNVLYARYF